MSIVQLRQEHWLSDSEAKHEISKDFRDYDFLTTSPDSFSPAEEVLLNYGPTWHGTDIGVKKTLIIEKFPVISTQFRGIKYGDSDNNSETIIYTAYLPTSGKDEEFIEEVSILTDDIQRHMDNTTDIVIGLDSNVSTKSTKRRQSAMKEFLEIFNLKSISSGDSPTFHHNNGLSKSQIDFIYTNNPAKVEFYRQLCQLNDSDNLSSHDIIIGSVILPDNEQIANTPDSVASYEDFVIKRPRWDSECLQDYQTEANLIIGDLTQTFNLPEHIPVLAELYSKILVKCA